MGADGARGGSDPGQKLMDVRTPNWLLLKPVLAAPVETFSRCV